MTANCAPDSLVNLLSYSRKTKNKRRSPINDLLHNGVKLDSWFPGQKHATVVDVTSKLCQIDDYCSNSYTNDNNNKSKKKKKRNNIQFDLSKIKTHSITSIDTNDSTDYWLSDAEYATIRESIHVTLRAHRRQINPRNDAQHDDEDINETNEICLRGIEHLITVPFAKSWNRRRLLYRQMTIVKYRMDKIASASEPVGTTDHVNIFPQQDTTFVNNPMLGVPSGILTTQSSVSSCDAERARQFGLLDETDAKVIYNTEL